jgi:hypothetical protein
MVIRDGKEEMVVSYIRDSISVNRLVRYIRVSKCEILVTSILKTNNVIGNRLC